MIDELLSARKRITLKPFPPFFLHKAGQHLVIQKIRLWQCAFKLETNTGQRVSGKVNPWMHKIFPLLQLICHAQGFALVRSAIK
ncbi:unnamed protein product [Cuscuta campestris]|uniref:Uncharacterized protein n=1 Tax=Cuscuta campestris TaxID=132261 RepID=A0A484LN63_9ASTE|nr:unnamed protein product [Cuscuta campestris]